MHENIREIESTFMLIGAQGNWKYWLPNKLLTECCDEELEYSQGFFNDWYVVELCVCGWDGMGWDNKWAFISSRIYNK